MIRHSSTVGVLLLLSAGALVRAQEPVSPRTLYEAGKYEQAAEAVKAEGDGVSPRDAYLAAQSLSRIDRNDEAKDVLRPFAEGDAESAWTYIARSAIAVIEGDLDGALQSANEAVKRAPDDFHAQFQVGLVRALKNDNAGAATALERATQIDPQDAYAHYYAGVAFNKIKRIDKMASHFRAFVSLAPDAPERPQVLAVLKSLRM